MITGLDEPSALDPKRVGAKAAALARGLRDGLPVLPGIVVETMVSLSHMEIGASVLSRRGSGGARQAVTTTPLPGAAQIEAAGRALSATLAVRSSSPLESDGVWAGAFASYTDVSPEELPHAVLGCWASVFTVDALDRQHRSGIEPGAVPLAVLIQPSIAPVVGGVAEITAEGTIRVQAVTGTPAPLLQGWVRGVAATRDPGGRWVGVDAIALVGLETLDDIGTALATAWSRFGYNRCEWGVSEGLWILQLGTVPPEPTPVPVTTTSPDLIPVVQVAMTTQGPHEIEPHLAAAVVLEHGVRFQGVPAAGGIGVGLRHVAGAVSPPSRAVVTAPQALPYLSQLIWDAVGLVTELGGPAAHVFETARSLGVPAVCGVDLGEVTGQIVAVDGYTGVVAVLPPGSIP
ncbi:MAG: PEP/pyruvate-binding domain-containing protein [Acidimicrobiia bacterium]